MVTSIDRILNAIDLNDPIDKIPKMELFSSVLPTVRFLINYHWLPEKIQLLLDNLSTEAINTVKEILHMKKRDPYSSYSRLGKTLRRMNFIRPIVEKAINDMTRKKSKAEIEKADQGTIDISALSMRVPIKLGYDMWSLMLLQSPDMLLPPEKSPDGNYYFVSAEGAFYDINPDDFEVMPKGVKDQNILTKIEASKLYYQTVDIERWTNLYEKCINKRIGLKKIKDLIVPTLLTVGPFETWLTTFGNFNMHGFFRHVMTEWKNGCTGPYFDLLKVKAEMNCKLIKRLSEIDGYKLHIIGDDCSTIHGPMLKPEIYRDFIAVHTKKIVAEAHKYDIKILFHSDGRFKLDAGNDPWKFMKILLDTKIDALHPTEMKANDMLEMRKHFSDKICLCNGIDTIELQNGTRKSVAKMTKNILEKAYEGAGKSVRSYIAGSDNSLFGGVKLHLVKQMLFTIDEYSKEILN
ncbi:MAG: uroporphyrinogen decarboxylase family protein [Candidatus Helarchaeota archaeon]